MDKDIPAGLTLTAEESLWFSRASSEKRLRHPYKITPHYASLLTDEADDPLRRQVIPTIKELEALDSETLDPLFEKQYEAAPRLIHRYRDRALLLVTDRCALYCRHCFRRYFTQDRGADLGREELQRVVEYIREHGEIHEILLSGGDPLTLPDERLLEIIRALRSERQDLVIRLCTRIPVVLPDRITTALARGLGEKRPLFIITQFNHPRELTPASGRAIEGLQKEGLVILNQTVLLKGINDSIEVLGSLFQRLLESGIKPYYLFQGDLAPGTGHFRVSLDRGRALVKGLRRQISGLAMPVYAVDLPGGGGKVPLTENYETGTDDDWHYFKGQDGLEYRYPKEHRLDR